MRKGTHRMDADAALILLDEMDAHRVPLDKLIDSDVGLPDHGLSSDKEEVLDATLLGKGSGLSDNDEWSNGSNSNDGGAVARGGFAGKRAGGQRGHGKLARGRGRGKRG